MPIKNFIGLRCWLAVAAMACYGSAFTQPVTPPAPYSSDTVNYIRTWDARAPESDANALISRPLRDVLQTTQYFDGLGRPLQTVVKQGSLVTGNDPTDLVSPVVYDEFGREQYKYLPFASDSSNGLFKLNPFEQQISFYNTQLAGQAGETNIGTKGENWAYSKTNYEPSPLNRIDNTYAPGVSWVGSEDASGESNKHNVRVQYLTNTATDAVPIWHVTDGAEPGDWGSYTTDSNYAPGTLYKTITTDEHDKQVIAFKDREGKLLLKKVQLSAAADTGSGKNYDGYLSTCYIYDDLGRLRCVTPPVITLSLATYGWNSLMTLSNNMLERGCYCYEYDSRNRMIMKKTPGISRAEAVYMCYDARDRLVLSQDGKQRKVSYWIATLYDALNRPVIRGFYLNALNGKTFKQNLAGAATSTAYPFAVDDQPPLNVYWSQTGEWHYDDYDNIPSLSGLTKDLDNTYTTGDYLHTSYNSSPLYAQQPVQSFRTRGMVTWSKTLILGSQNYLYSVNIYDDKGRLIQVKSTNLQGGEDITTTQYNWAGQPLRIIQKTSIPGGGGQTGITITDISYDDLGRAQKTQKKIQHSLVSSNAIPTEWTLISEQAYDALGQLKQKGLGQKRNSSGGYTSDKLSHLDYAYNVRGWLLSVNKEYTEGDNSNDQYFSLELGYDKDPSMGNSGTHQYNGNIRTMLWKSEGDHKARKYDFSYDATSRLTAAAFTQHESGTGGSAVFGTTAGVDFSVTIPQYDDNGNIKKLNRKGLKLNSSATIDSLTYSYYSYYNSPYMIGDAVAADPNARLGDFLDGAPGAGDYNYNNGNGSLTTDFNKGINSIAYWNTLEQVKTVTYGNGNTVNYLHTVDNMKLRKTTVEKNAQVAYNGSSHTSDITTVTDYIGAAVFESKSYSNDTLNSPLGYSKKLQLVAHEEGRIRALYSDTANPNTPTGFAYDYFIKDHLGNIRMVLTDENQPADMYPPATMEDAAIATEERYYGNLSSTVNGKPGGFDSDTGNHKVSELNYSNAARRIGPNALLRVMSGDRVSISVDAFYSSIDQDNSNSSVVADVVASLVSAFGGGTSTAMDPTGHYTIGDRNITSFNTTSYPDINNALKSDDPNTDNGKPKAYVNWILFDEQFNMVRSSSATRQVDMAADTKQQMAYTDIAMHSNGYLYVYLSNESLMSVFFDNFQVTHQHGPILEETHYYPFGMTMAGISSKALNNAVENKYRFNSGNELQNKEFSDGSGLEWYDANFRGYDAQIGRFMQIDPLAEATDNISPYVFGYNNPVIINDPLGLLGDTTVNGVHYDDAKTLSEVVIILHGNNNSNSNASGTTSSAGFVEFDTGRNPFGNSNESRVSPAPLPQISPEIEVERLPLPPPINPWILRGGGLLGLLLYPTPLGEGSTMPVNTWNPHYFDSKNPPPTIPRDYDNLYLVRFGPLPESQEKLASDAAKALAHGFPHGVSTVLRSRISGSDKYNRRAFISEVRRYFNVYKTGVKPDHYTVELPSPVTKEVADLFNSIFQVQ